MEERRLHQEAAGSLVHRVHRAVANLEGVRSVLPARQPGQAYRAGRHGNSFQCSRSVAARDFFQIGAFRDAVYGLFEIEGAQPDCVGSIGF